MTGPALPVCAVINPASSGGRTAALWPDLKTKLEARIGPVQPVFTAARGSATDLTRSALRAGMQTIIAVGGDGTVNECVNGFFQDGEPVAPEASLAMIMSGTGGDLRRTLGFDGSLDAYVDAIAAGPVQSLDLGRLDFARADGAPATRMFINIASFGISGAVVTAVNRAQLSKWLGGRFAFFWATLTTGLTYAAPMVSLTLDGGPAQTLPLHVAAVANGRFFGGGMMIAPDADPQDGMFDLVTIRRLSFLESAGRSGAIYRGAHVSDPKVSVARVRTLVAEPADGVATVLLDVDGEAPGRLPARFEIVPRAIKIHMPATA